MTEKQQALFDLLQSQPNLSAVTSEDCICVSNDEGIDAFVYIGDKQIIAETALFPADLVKDTGKLNEHILQSHSIVPLTSVGLRRINDEDYYVAFGALSTDSKDEVIVEEIETLFENVPEFIELYSEHFSSN
tara:strand:- start:178 stop:573 length:396 start_codon:yes stop_codon:yes gene_type:complete